MKTNRFLCLLFLPLLCASCGTMQNQTKIQAYPEMYKEKPMAVAIMPPINTTNNVEAKEFLFLTLSQPVCERGYYVIPPFLCMEMYKGESAYDAELFIDGSAKRFAEVLGADAVLFTKITKWEKAAVASVVTVECEYILKSTHTNEIIFRRKGNLKYDGSVNVSGGGLVGALVGMAASAMNTALTEHITVARACNNFTLSDMPAGNYHPDYGTDETKAAGLQEFRQTIK